MTERKTGVSFKRRRCEGAANGGCAQCVRLRERVADLGRLRANLQNEVNLLAARALTAEQRLGPIGCEPPTRASA
jgi:hypothetical protein